MIFLEAIPFKLCLSKPMSKLLDFLLILLIFDLESLNVLFPSLAWMFCWLPVSPQLFLPGDRTLTSDYLRKVSIIVTFAFLHFLFANEISHLIPIEYFLLGCTFGIRLISIPFAWIANNKHILLDTQFLLRGFGWRMYILK